MAKIVIFNTIQFDINTQFTSIWRIDRTLSGATNPVQSEPGNDGIKGVLFILIIRLLSVIPMTFFRVS